MAVARSAAWTAGTGVVLAGVQSYVVNQADAGIGWVWGAFGVTVVGAVLVFWLTSRQDQPPAGARLDAGAVQAGTVKGSIRTRVRTDDPTGPATPDPGGQGTRLGPGAVQAGSVDGDIETDVDEHADRDEDDEGDAADGR